MNILTDPEHSLFNSDLKQVLQKDFDYRLNKNDDNDLLEFDMKESESFHDYSYFPVAIPPSTITQLFPFNKDFKNTVTAFFRSFIENKILTDNMVVVGGKLVSFLYNADEKGIYRRDEDYKLYSNANMLSQDIDIFFYGLTPVQIKEKIMKSIENMKEKIQNIYINENCIELDYFDPSIYNTFKFQFILRSFSSISDILHSFDVGCCSIGYDIASRKVYTTSLGEWCLKCRCNVVDVTRASTTYEKRLYKYFKRGFSIIYPDFREVRMITHDENLKLLVFHRYSDYTVKNSLTSYKIKLDNYSLLKGDISDFFKSKMIQTLKEEFLKEYFKQENIKIVDARQINYSFFKKEIKEEDFYGDFYYKAKKEEELPSPVKQEDRKEIVIEIRNNSDVTVTKSEDGKRYIIEIVLK